jgi:hypothetical protein
LITPSGKRKLGKRKSKFLSIRNSKEIQTAILIEETAEVIQIFRDSGWDSYIKNLSNGIKYYLI